MNANDSFASTRITRIATGKVRALLFVTLLLSASNALAQSCDFNTADANFGNLSSVAVRDAPQTTTGHNTLRCGSGISLLSDSEVHATPSSENAFELATPDGNRIPYSALVRLEDGTILPLVQGQRIQTNFFHLLALLGIGGAAGEFDTEFSIVPGRSVAAGTYTDQIRIDWNWRVCILGILGICVWDPGVDVTFINVKLVVENDCEMNTPPLDFGTAPLAGVFTPATQNIQIRCSPGAMYDVGLSDGNHFDGRTRRMRRGASNDYLEYELFQTLTSSDRWGSGPGQRRNSTDAEINPGVHDGSNWQGFTYRGVINPDQPTPPSGTYTDNIVVDVEF